jgi:phosphotransferase system  glucose/maltose/N-acetylglucosamine-specific IIC component
MKESKEQRKQRIEKDAKKFSLWIVLPLAPAMFKIMIWVITKINPEFLYISFFSSKVFMTIMMIGLLISNIALLVVAWKLVKTGLGEPY